MATDWGSFFEYDAPTIAKERRTSFNPGGVPGNIRQEQNRNVVTMGKVGGLNSAMDDMLKGYDAQSSALEGKLKSIYDNYEANYKQYGETMKPLMDAIEGDIGRFNEYIGDYEGLVSGMEGDFLDSILVDPNASRTRGEYMGNVASQYDQAQDAMRRQAIQQGQNPYANKGGQREMTLNRAGDLAGAANEAYGDWREAYNQDIQRQQQANSQYANLFGRTGDMYGNLLGARSALMQGQQGLYETQLGAQQAKAAGYEGLLGRQDNLRREALSLAQNQSAQAIEAQNAANQIKGSLKGQDWYNPDFNAGGSQRNS